MGQLTNSKLQQFNPDKLDALLDNNDYPIKNSTIRKAYSAWLRNDKDDRVFEDVLEDKLEKYHVKLQKKKSKFVSEKVGVIRVNFDKFTYVVSLEYSNPWKVSFVNPTEKKLRDSIDKFCSCNSIELKNEVYSSNLCKADLYTTLKV